MTHNRFVVFSLSDAADELGEDVVRAVVGDRKDALDYGSCLVDMDRRTIVGTDGGEPEDQMLTRDWRWVAEALNRVAGEQAFLLAEVERLKALHELARCRNVASKAVREWMNTEGRAGRLRYNGDAPGWPAYEEAQQKLDEALAAVGTEPR